MLNLKDTWDGSIFDFDLSVQCTAGFRSIYVDRSAAGGNLTEKFKLWNLSFESIYESWMIFNQSIVTSGLLLYLKAKFMIVHLIKYFINFDLWGPQEVWNVLPWEQNHRWSHMRCEGWRQPQTQPRWQWRSWWAGTPAGQSGRRCWWVPSSGKMNIILELCWGIINMNNGSWYYYIP